MIAFPWQYATCTLSKQLNHVVLLSNTTWQLLHRGIKFTINKISSHDSFRGFQEISLTAQLRSEDLLHLFLAASVSEKQQLSIWLPRDGLIGGRGGELKSYDLSGSIKLLMKSLLLKLGYNNLMLIFVRICPAAALGRLILSSCWSMTWYHCLLFSTAPVHLAILLWNRGRCSLFSIIHTSQVLESGSRL